MATVTSISAEGRVRSVRLLDTDKVNGITDDLEHAASIKKNVELTRVNAYYDGYVQACEDFRKSIVGKLYENATEE